MLVCSCRKDHGQFTGYGISRGHSIAKFRPKPHDGVRIVGRLSRGDVASIQAETPSPSRPAKLDPAANPFADSHAPDGPTRKTGEDFGYGRRVQTFRQQPVGAEIWDHVRRRLPGTRKKSHGVPASTFCQVSLFCGPAPWPAWWSQVHGCPDPRRRPIGRDPLAGAATEPGGAGDTAAILSGDARHCCRRAVQRAKLRRL